MVIQKHVRKLTGQLSNENFYVLERVVFDEINSVIGLDLMIDRPQDDDEYIEGRLHISEDGDRLILSKSSIEEGGSEILVNGNLSHQWAMWRADGFFTVKSGGMQQGICSIGLHPIEEALISLNPAIKIVTVKIDGC